VGVNKLHVGICHLEHRFFGRRRARPPPRGARPRTRRSLGSSRSAASRSFDGNGDVFDLGEQHVHEWWNPFRQEPPCGGKVVNLVEVLLRASPRRSRRAPPRGRGHNTDTFPFDEVCDAPAARPSPVSSGGIDLRHRRGEYARRTPERLASPRLAVVGEVDSPSTSSGFIHR